jgi:quercetin dioxygenase-like cupin family protein
MAEVFPDFIRQLRQADIPLKGLTAHLLQGACQQVLFMKFDEDADIPLHAHESQWSIVLEGRIDINMGGVTRTYVPGDRFFVPKGTAHSAKIHAGYTDITFFDDKGRYKTK